MKKLLFSLSALFLTTVLFAQKADEVAKFKTDVIDMGTIQVGNPTTVTFEVTNIGKTPLIIETANPTCGCTIGDYTKEPIMPGKKGKITATYNAAAVAPFTKHLNVKFAGIDEMKSITIKGVVLSKEDYAKVKAATPPVKKTKTDTKKLGSH